MKNLKCFVLGMATAIIALPIADSLTEVVLGKLECVKANNTKKILKANKEIEDLRIQLEGYHDEGNAIGFQIEEPCEEEYDDDEEWEDKTKNKKIVGFV